MNLLKHLSIWIFNENMKLNNNHFYGGIYNTSEMAICCYRDIYILGDFRDTCNNIITRGHNFMNIEHYKGLGRFNEFIKTIPRIPSPYDIDIRSEYVYIDM
jgi:hypothetical protein